MKFSKRARVWIAVLAILLIFVACIFLAHEKKTAMVIYKGSISDSNIIKKVSWDEKEIIATVLVLLNNCDPVEFDTSQTPEYTISIKRNQSKIFLLEKPIYYDIYVYKGDFESIILYCDDIGNGKKLGPSKVLDKTFSYIMSIVT